jgi:hypothetical protein
MIIACSAKSLQLIESAIFDRRSKDVSFPLIVSDKDKLEIIRKHLDNDPQAYGMLWNLDIEESPLGGWDGEQIGVHRYGFLFNRDFGATVVLNGLDGADMSTIGEVSWAGIETVLRDFVISPETVERYFDNMARVRDALFEEAELRASGSPFGLRPTILFANSNRSAASVVRSQKDLAHARLYSGKANVISHGLVERYLCFLLNKGIVKVRKVGSNEQDYVAPLKNTRSALNESSLDLRTSAAKIRIQLIGHQDVVFEPLCYREIIVPLTAPLEWIHQMIQKTMNWADYHLHHFDFLDREAAKILNDAFFDIFNIEDIYRYDSVNRFSQEDGEQVFCDLTNLSLRWLYGDFTRAMEEQRASWVECPVGHLPESMPLGLALLGSTAYPNVLDRLTRTEVSLSADEYRCHPLRYEYDYGDGWELSVTPIEFTVSTAGHIPVITAAQGQTPPEDCGGLGGFSDFLRDIDPDDDYKREDIDLLAWARGNGWQPFRAVEDLRTQFDIPFTWEY